MTADRTPRAWNSSLPQRTSWLDRGTSSLGRSVNVTEEGAVTGRPRIKPRSKKRAAQEVQFARLKPKWLDGKVCAWCGTDQGLDIHHMRGRVGADLLDQDHWLPLCRPHHDFVGEHPVWAKANGYSEDRNTRRTA